MPNVEAAGAVAALFAAVALLAGCMGDGGSTTAATGTTATAEDPLVIEGFHVLGVFEVHETEYSLEPASVGFQRVGYFGIRAFNDGKEPHALVVSGPGVSRRIPTIQPGESAAIAVFFRKPGSYRFYCPLDDHEARGMRGVIRVH